MSFDWLDFTLGNQHQHLEQVFIHREAQEDSANVLSFNDGIQHGFFRNYSDD
jgi:hypothetical protein